MVPEEPQRPQRHGSGGGAEGGAGGRLLPAGCSPLQRAAPGPTPAAAPAQAQFRRVEAAPPPQSLLLPPPPLPGHNGRQRWGAGGGPLRSLAASPVAMATTAELFEVGAGSAGGPPRASPSWA